MPETIDSKRTLQEITDISLKNGTFKDFSLDELRQMGTELIARVGVYDVIRDECKADFFYFIDAILKRVAGADPETGINKFEYSRARHFRWMKYLIDSALPPAEDLMEMNRFRSGKNAPHPYHLATSNTWHNKKLMLLPRNHGKSRIGNIAYNMWRLLNNPNMRILILSEIRQNAVDMLFMIKDLYQKISDSKNSADPLPYYVMGNWVPPQGSGGWNEDAIRVLTRTVSETVPSIATAGMESEIVSKHFDLICCLLPETLVLTSNGYVVANDLRKGQKVLSSDGKFHTITNKIIKKSDESVVEIRASYQPHGNKFTANHEILVWRGSGFIWLPASGVKKSDMLVVPRCIARNGPVSRVNKRINSLLKKEDIWRLIGYWLAEGCHIVAGGQIRLSFSDKEIEYVNDVMDIVKKYLEKPVNYHKTKSSTFLIQFSDSDMKTILGMFGTKSYTKHIPPFALNQSANKQRQLIIGYFRGDGCKCGEVVNFSSNSLSLLTGIQLILAKFGIPSSVIKNRNEGRGVIAGVECNVRDGWNLNTTHPFAKMLVGFDAGKFPIQPFNSFFTKDFWVIPIHEIKYHPKSTEPVIDITVDKTSDFYCPGMIVHNCDDVVGEQNITTPEQIEKHKAKISRLTEVGDYDRSKVTDYIFFGTRWHYSDYYSVILDELSEIYDIMKFACWDGDTHEPLFPEKYTKEMLETIRIEKLSSPHPEEWSNQWLNEPMESANATFTRDSLNWYENVDEVLKGSFVAIFGDTAWTENEWSDETAFVPIAIGSYNTRYILPYEHFKTNNPYYAANKLIALAAPYYNMKRYRGTFVEDGPFFSAIFPIISDRAPWVNLIPLKNKNRKKDPLILNIAALTTHKKLFLRKNMYELIEQLIRWPRYDKKDIINAVAYQFDVYPISTMGPANPERPYPSIEERFHRRTQLDDEKAKVRSKL